MSQSSAPASPQTDRFWWTWLICITTVGFLIRAVNLFSQSFYYDEIVTAGLTRASFSALASGVARDNGNPPLFWLLAKAAVTLFGDSETVLRGITVLAGTAALPSFGLLGRRLFGVRAGLIAAALLALSPLSLEFSTEARVYPIVQLLAITATLCFILWLEYRRPLLLVPYVLLIVLGCWSHYYFAFIPIAHGLAVLATRDLRRCLHWLASMLAAALLYSPWLPVFLRQVQTPGNLARGGERWLFQFLATPVAFTLGRSFAWRSDSHAALAFAVLAALLLFWLPASYALVRKNIIRGHAILLGSWLILPVAVPLLVAILKAPLYNARYGAIAIPALLLLIAAFLDRVPTRYALPTGALILLLCSASVIRFSYVPNKDDWNRASAWLNPRLSPDGIVVVEPDEDAIAYLYHVRSLRQAPPDVVAVLPEATFQEPLSGVLYHDGVRLEHVSTPHNAELYGHHRIWLLRLASAHSLQRYEDLFHQHSFKPVESVSLYGIELTEFRVTNP